MSEADRTPNSESPSLNSQELAAVLAALASMQRHRRARSYRVVARVVRVLCRADLSASEVLGSDVGDLDGDKLAATGGSRGVSGGSPRVVRLTADGATAAAELAGDRDVSEPLVTGRGRGGRLSQDHRRDVWARALILAELPHVPLSALRGAE